MKTYIKIQGCDDSTVISIELDDAGRTIVDKLCTLSVEKSDYRCQPTMKVLTPTEIAFELSDD